MRSKHSEDPEMSSLADKIAALLPLIALFGIGAAWLLLQPPRDRVTRIILLVGVLMAGVGSCYFGWLTVRSAFGLDPLSPDKRAEYTKMADGHAEVIVEMKAHRNTFSGCADKALEREIRVLMDETIEKQELLVAELRKTLPNYDLAIEHRTKAWGNVIQLSPMWASCK